ncbi:amino acid ABC transporter substrate-binding protein (PAAT family) [Rhizobium sp. PP-F2F-G48]|uniref:transporter substrate-binding domain-containing protein n=1 Tax=Rhizobium sp. PP-F2F-G48 TaxID=2135651 RepID=UPI0010478647|nr:transporter substrate-binding domain-containing protein [Rhizobium sp. PP-F2F-G48]TCM56132.1 amino acid ABC transporter substrate-binding protein (PAAT family) [Rhizobium sp. PP-F2F-G48]
MFSIQPIIRNILSIFAVAWIGGSSVQAAEPVRELPLAFDVRERIAKPDLGGLARLRFLTTVDFPPFNFIDQSQKLSGFHIDLAREICRILDIEAKCQIQAVTFEELQPALEDGQGEAVIAGVAMTDELRQRFAFTRPFLRLPARFATRLSQGSGGGAGGKAELSAVLAKSIGVVAGTTHEAMLKAFFPAATAQVFPDRAAMLQSLKAGDVNAVFSDGLQLSFWAASPDAAACCRLVDGAYVSEHFLGEGLAIMNRKGDPALTQALDHALLELTRSGRLNEIYLRYFPTGIY